ncbi:Uncharacterized protein APZ42_031033 [Daphnia magna]|uniref:Uncharacterized protein n=1 Tax=Daphnia magna TaxID=35525 RepID=A0A164N9X5_9CRUS|nr:Uncharacterized protein APZ42_031033 [Daphnia magna]
MNVFVFSLLTEKRVRNEDRRNESRQASAERRRHLWKRVGTAQEHLPRDVATHVPARHVNEKKKNIKSKKKVNVYTVVAW